MQYYKPILVAVLLVLVLMASDAAAYLDPGTGSFALQIMAASVVAVGFFVRKYWNWIAHFFGRGNANSDDEKNR
jgi:hypothetical protein